MATTLGLSFFFHDSAAAIVRDGQIVAAAAEERFCRRKHTNEFPKRAIEYCLEAAGLESVNELDAIVFYEKPLTKFLRIIETLVQTWPRSIGIFTRRLPNFLAAKFNVYRVIEQELLGYQGEVFFAEHHLSHAASAFYCSPFERAAILTTDGVGEWETTTLGVGEGREINLDCAIHFPHSIGLLYSALTSYLGFQVNDGEWKVMGLAPYGEPKYVEQFRELVHLKPDGSFRLNMKYFVHHYSAYWTAHERRWRSLFGIPRRQPKAPIEQHHEDLARSGQAVVEELILALAREARRRTGSNNLVIAGGVGLNSVANWKIEKEGVFENVWIQPAAGDDGGALGAALLISQQVFQDPPTAEMKHAYLGPEFSDEETRSFLEMKGIPGERVTDQELVERVADAITQGSVVGWCRGRMELGPRALGARSILADATNPEMKTIINKKIKYREYFRPFAPAVPLEDAHKYFEVEPGTEMPFMLKVPAVRAEARSKIPAVTHEDGSGRVQTVTEEINPLYYRVLKALVPRVGVSVVLNTSFNVRGEPIVCTPEDAYNCFINTGIDLLVVGNYLITQKPAVEVDTEAGYRRSDAMEKRIGAEGPEPAVVRGSILDTGATAEVDTVEKVLAFYKELPFNYYSNAIDTSVELLRQNRIREYPDLDRYLRQRQALRVLDLGCGAGWFSNSCAHYYGHATVGLDVNPVALRQARSVARLLPSGAKVEFVCSDLFAYEPEEPFDVVNSLGVLHHTPDCHAAIQKALTWIAPGGYLHLGLYHRYGRQPFLDHFARLKNGHASFGRLFEEFERLNPDISDQTHLLSWFRDQVLHPHETQHTYEELHQLLTAEGFTIESTSINNFGKLAPLADMIEAEKECALASEKALRQGRYYPGFFVVWARKLNGAPIAAKSQKDSRSHARSETGIAG